jgi:phage terminase small subunit
MLTDKKRKFAEALFRGCGNADAAVAAGYTERSADVTGARLARDSDVLGELARLRGESQSAVPEKASDPKDFLFSVMNDLSIDIKLRQDAAKALMPYLYPKLGESGKKDKQREAAAERAGGKFAPGVAPQLRVVGK